MSITISVGANGATTGRTDQTIPGDGEIDTRAEAEAALAHLPDGSTNTVRLGSREYTRAQLIEIRDRPAATAVPPPPADTATIPGPGVSHGVALDGYYGVGLSDRAHPGGAARLSYIPGITLLGGEHRLFLDPSIGFEAGHFSMDYNTPGGEPASSALTRYGGALGVALRYAPPIVQNRLWASLGVRLGFGGFSSEPGTTVSLPGTCVPGDFGRGECEPGAGPRTGNAGTSGVIDTRVGSSREGSGAYVNFGIPIAIGGDVHRGDYGNTQLFAMFEPTYSHIIPSGSPAFGFWNAAIGAGLRVNFGGGAVERPRSTGPSTDDARTHSTEIPGGAEFSLADAAAVRALGGLSADARILGVQLDDHPEDTSAPYTFDAAWMTPGAHTIKIRYRNPGDTEDRIRPVNITVGTPAPVVLPPEATGSAYGVVPNILTRVARPALTPGVAAGPLTIGNVEVTSAVPQGAVLAIFVDGTEVGTVPLQPNTPGTDHVATVTIPAGTADGPHQIGMRIRRPGAGEVRFNDRAIAIGPGVATLSAASVPSNPPSGGHYYNDPIRVTVTSDVATRARITVGSYTEDVNLVVGVNTITMAGHPRTWTTGGAAGRSTHTVRIQPLDAAGALAGTGIDVGPVVIRRAGGGGGGPARPRLPGAGGR